MNDKLKDETMQRKISSTVYSNKCRWQSVLIVANNRKYNILSVLENKAQLKCNNKKINEILWHVIH